MPTYVLTALARESGGRAYFPRSIGELDGVYDRIASELRTLYGVGYVPLNPSADGRFRRIAIRTRQANLQVRTRTGYYASRRKPQRLPDPAGELPLGIQNSESCFLEPETSSQSWPSSSSTGSATARSWRST